jgi:MoxR-like ATPase
MSNHIEQPLLTTVRQLFRKDATTPQQAPVRPDLVKDVQEASKVCEKIVRAVGSAVLGKPTHIQQAVACLLAQGHLLIEDVPGVGKTTLAHALACALGLRFNRVQFTSDLMPADVVGGSIYDREQQAFVFHPGPVFTEVLLADEINRASPKTQSALLEAMAEAQVSVEGKTHTLPKPFFVIATQNPSHQMGTFPLPESQMDRFLMSLSLGYPDKASEMQMLMGASHKTNGQRVESAVTPSQVLKLQQLVKEIVVSEAAADYAYRVIVATRQGNDFIDGLSPRAGMSWMAAAQAWALMKAREYVTPDDLKAVFMECVLHRLQARSGGAMDRAQASKHLQNWLRNIPIEG